MKMLISWWQIQFGRVLPSGRVRLIKDMDAATQPDEIPRIYFLFQIPPRAIVNKALLTFAPGLSETWAEKHPKTPILGVLGGTKNGTSGVRIKILRPLFNTNTPLKPPFRHFGNHFGPRKSDFWPFYLFWSFSHWNSHWSRKIVPTWEGKVAEQKQKQFWNQWTKWQNLGACKIMISEKS